MSEIIDFQDGREARIRGRNRDARRNADWLRGWDMEEDAAQRWHDDFAKRNPPLNPMEAGRG